MYDNDRFVLKYSNFKEDFTKEIAPIDFDKNLEILIGGDSIFINIESKVPF
jgi:hypothetical protein